MKKPSRQEKQDAALAAERKARAERQGREANAAASRKRIDRQKQELLQKMLKQSEREEAQRQAEAEFKRIKPSTKSTSRRKK